MADSVDAAALRDRFFEYLSPRVRPVIERAIEFGGTASPLYLVGGALRAVILDDLHTPQGARIDVDADVVIEGDARVLAARVATSRDRLVVHDAFLTATVQVDDALGILGAHVDFATARRETYTEPAALPKVEPADIDTDLRRRDFTIGAIALSLTGVPRLLDPVGGLGDLAGGIVRVLHDHSFIDDPTRIFRALTLANHPRRRGTIETHKATLMREGIPYIQRLSGDRVREQLGSNFRSALQAMHDEGVLAAVHPALSWTPRKSAALGKLLALGDDRPDQELALMAADSTPAQAREITQRLDCSRRESDVIIGIVALGEMAHILRRPDVKPSGVVAALDRYPREAVRAFAAYSDDSRVERVMTEYLERWSNEAPILTGDDLLAMGIPEGPQVGRGLQLIRAARLDGWATDRDDERALILRFAKSIRDSRAMNQPIDFKFNGN
jgi:tRNA nucleotidyltransferase (CCA-adding enzyme)